MGPTNTALVNLLHADQRLRDAQERLDAAERNVRIQDRRVNDLTERVKVAQAALREQQTRVRTFELDIAARDAHIEKLRTQQQNTHNNKEYQAFLVEINTGKVDKTKVEEELIRVMEAVEKGKADTTTLEQQLAAEKAKLEAMRAQVGDTVAKLKAEVESLRPEREQAAAAVPPKPRDAFERLASHHDGEAMAAIGKPDRRREEYVCMACHMELARDVYNKLRTRDELVFCPSCRRILYIPTEFSPEDALGTAKPTVKRTRTTTTRGPRKAAASSAAGGAEVSPAAPIDAVEIELRAKGKLGQALTKAQGETVRSANAAGQNPVECEVYVNDKLAGIYKGQTPDHLLRAAKYYLGEAGIEGEVRVVPVPNGAGAESPAEPEPAEGAPAEQVADAAGAPASEVIPPTAPVAEPATPEA